MSIAPSLRFLGAALAALALLFSGCGPGVGGTGTGETGGGLAAFGALPASVCGGELASIVSCSTTAGAAAPTPSASAVLLADTIDGRQVRVTLSGDSVEVGAPCARIQFRGEWGVLADQPGRFYGSADVDGTRAAAALEARVSDSDVQLTVRDLSGRVLLGPLLVRVVVTLATPPVCN